MAFQHPFTLKAVTTLPSYAYDPQFTTSAHVTMESDKYICIREMPHRNSLLILDMNMPIKPLRLRLLRGKENNSPSSWADSAIMHPNSRIVAMKSQIQGTVQHGLHILNIDLKTNMKSCKMPEQVTFWKWISPKMLGLVTETAVYHWSLEGDGEPIKMFERTANLANNKIINYQCDPTEKWLVLIGTAPGTPERPQLLKGNMQLFSVDEQHSQAVEAHAASFAQFKVPGNENPSVLISFASKTLNDAGQVISKLHVAELGAQPGKPSFTRKQAPLFPPNVADDFPVSMLISHKYGLIYVISNQGLLFVYDLETATPVYRNILSPDPIFLTSEATSVGGFYAVNTRGQVLLVTVNEQTIVNFVSGQLNNLKLAVSLAKRGNLPGAERLAVVVERFRELFAQTKYEEAAELAAESPQGILRTPATVAKFQSVPVQAGETPPLQLYFEALSKRGKLDAFESLELTRLVVTKTKNNTNILKSLFEEGKLECSEELGDLVKAVDNNLAVDIYMKAVATTKLYTKAVATKKVVAALAESGEFDKMQIGSKQGVL